MSYLFDYDYTSNTWHLANTPGSATGSPDPYHRFTSTLPQDNSFIVYGEVIEVTGEATCGLLLEVVLEGSSITSWRGFSVYQGMGAAYGPGQGVAMTANGPVVYGYHQSVELRVTYQDYGTPGTPVGSLTYDYSVTPNVWVTAHSEEVDEMLDTGLALVLLGDPSAPADGYIRNVAEIPGLAWVGFGEWEEFYMDIPGWFEMTRTPHPVVDLEPVVYGLVGAPFGDQEFDVGKSARWLEYFTDKMFITDVNLGDPRYWIINWTQTFPHAEHGITNINYFETPVEFRKEQYRQAQAKFKMGGEDWVLWIDGSEGLSFDNASLPNDYDFIQFTSFIYREISRAEDEGEDRVVLPYFVFLRSGDVQNVTYDHPSNSQPVSEPGDPLTPPVMQAMSVPYYLPHQGLCRLMKVSALRDPDFDWNSLDSPMTPSSGVKAQIVSYAYGHWQYLNIPPGETEVPPMTEDNDEGWKMRKRISQVRPIPGLPTVTWNPDDQPDGIPGPWGKYILTNTNPDFAEVVDTPMTDPHDDALGVKTPLYDTVIRLNMRDGVWYEGDASGNTPMVWDSVNEKWTTPYDPTLWPSASLHGGVNAPANPDYVEPPTPTGTS